MREPDRHRGHVDVCQQNLDLNKNAVNATEKIV